MKKRLQLFDVGPLTLSCARSAEILTLNWRVARSLDLAWQVELEVLHHTVSGRAAECLTIGLTITQQ